MKTVIRGAWASWLALSMSLVGCASEPVEEPSTEASPEQELKKEDNGDWIPERLAACQPGTEGTLLDETLGDRLDRARRVTDRRVRASVRAEKLGEVAAHFDNVHSIHRAVEVGSVDEVIEATDLRPRIISALEAGLAG